MGTSTSLHLLVVGFFKGSFGVTEILNGMYRVQICSLTYTVSPIINLIYLVPLLQLLLTVVHTLQQGSFFSTFYGL